MAHIVLTDASPLIGLSIVDGLSWLQTLFGHVCVPDEVRRGVLSGSVARGETDVRRAIDHGWLRVWSEPVSQILVRSARQVFEVLHRSDFRISAEVIRTVLERVEES